MSRTLRSTLRFALPFILSVPVALGACGGNSSFTPTTETDPGVNPPPDPTAPPPVEGPVYAPDTNVNSSPGTLGIVCSAWLRFPSTACV